MKIILWLWLKLVRSWKSPLLYWLLRYTKYRGRELPEKWDEIKELPEDEFSDQICNRTQYDYKFQWLGVFDFSPQEKNFFFLERNHNRDCAHWARMWYWYHKYHEREVYEIAILKTDYPIEFHGWKPYINSHKVTVAKMGDKYQLFDYRPITQKENTVEKVLQNNVVGYNNFVWVINKKINK